MNWHRRDAETQRNPKLLLTSASPRLCGKEIRRAAEHFRDRAATLVPSAPSAPSGLDFKISIPLRLCVSAVNKIPL